MAPRGLEGTGLRYGAAATKAFAVFADEEHKRTREREHGHENKKAGIKRIFSTLRGEYP